MFTPDFYPTPKAVAEIMLDRLGDVAGKTVLEPSAGKGNLVDELKYAGANVIACEKHQDLKKILVGKCQVIADDFLKVTSSQISHVSAIVMNPPFSNADTHILHAYEIAPSGCKIVALCNVATIMNPYSQQRERLKGLIDHYGMWEDLGECFDSSERKTNVGVAMVVIEKRGDSYEEEFEGFFLGDDQVEQQENGIMSYNVVRDVVNRYVSAVKLYDQQLDQAVQMNGLIRDFYGSYLNSRDDDSKVLMIDGDDKIKERQTFKKEIQKKGWMWIFDKMNLQKYATKGLRDDINKFVEQQTQIPFTMRNIYRMIEIVIGTTEQRMDKALLEVFEKLTDHYDENRFNVEGWKTNSHYLVNRKFIMPHVVTANYSGGIRSNYYGWAEPIEDLQKALCYLTGMNYDECITFERFLSDNGCKFGQEYKWGFFTFRAYKKGTTHFTFQDEELWARFNQRIGKLKGFPLYEYKPTKASKKADQATAKNYRGRAA